MNKGKYKYPNKP